MTSLHSAAKKSQSGNSESKRCELILSNLHLLDLHDIMILQISLQRSESERSEHYLCFFYSNVTSVLGGREINETKIALTLLKLLL